MLPAAEKGGVAALARCSLFISMRVLKKHTRSSVLGTSIEENGENRASAASPLFSVVSKESPEHGKWKVRVSPYWAEKLQSLPVLFAQVKPQQIRILTCRVDS